MSLKPHGKIDEFCRVLSAETGLRTDDIHMESIEKAVERRMEQLDLDTEAEYAEMLEDPAALRAEVKAVIAAIMGAETAFFRYREHFDLLREHLLPEILRRVGRDRSVRLWNAGCSSGEETYSAALLLDMYFRRFAESAYVIGTDINPEAIARAEAACYGAESLDGLDSRELEYFTRSGSRYLLNSCIKRRVVFARLNLVDGLPDYERAGVRAIDIVICRDVLLHLQPEIAQRVVIQIFESMAPGGYLILGRAEGMLAVNSPLEHCAYEDTVYCRKPFIRRLGDTPLFGIH